MFKIWQFSAEIDLYIGLISALLRARARIVNLCTLYHVLWYYIAPNGPPNHLGIQGNPSEDATLGWHAGKAGENGQSSKWVHSPNLVMYPFGSDRRFPPRATLASPSS